MSGTWESRTQKWQLARGIARVISPFFLASHARLWNTNEKLTTYKITKKYFNYTAQVIYLPVWGNFSDNGENNGYNKMITAFVILFVRNQIIIRLFYFAGAIRSTVPTQMIWLISHLTRNAKSSQCHCQIVVEYLCHR